MSHVLRRVRWVLMTAALMAPSLSSSVLSAQSAPPAVHVDSAIADSMFDWSGHPYAMNACVAAIPRERMWPAPVFLHATVSDSTNRALTVQADLMAQDVAGIMLTSLGGSPAKLPNADSIITPASVPAGLIVIAHPDGSVSRRAVSMTGDTTATSVLTRAFDAARRNSTALIVWPDSYKAESVVVRLLLRPAGVTPRGNVVVDSENNVRFGVFRLLQPSLTPALAKMGNPAPRYPPIAESEGVSAELLMQFVVDTNGRAERGTIHDLWPANLPPLTGYLAQYYHDFVVATRDAVINWNFTPARIDVCPVRQRVQLPLRFVQPHHG